MINNIDTKEYYRHYTGLYVSSYIKDPPDKRIKVDFRIVCFIAFIMFILGFILAKPIYANDSKKNTEFVETGQIVYNLDDFKESIQKKYQSSQIVYPTDGIAHIKKIKYINSKPVKINIVELNTRVNKNLEIKPQTANNTLKSKSTVRRIAQKDNAIIAINAGFFKPQTGLPLGALMIDRKILTGPIFNRVGIGIFEDDCGNISYKMDNITFDIKANTISDTLKIDNINQPRMQASTTLLYTSDWGKISPPPPQNGYNILIQGNKITKMSANPIEMAENDFVISSSKEIITNFAKNKEVYIHITPVGIMQNAKHIIGAGPYLVKNSEVYVDVKEQKLEAITGKNPRSAIGYTTDGSLVILTVDGRESASVGMTLYELAKYMKSLGCVEAMNFDGGSSSALYVKGKIVNDALNKEGVAVSNALTISEVNNDTMAISSL